MNNKHSKSKAESDGGGAKPENNSERTVESDWPQPQPLPTGLAPVAPFDLSVLPDLLVPWVGDISDHLQCPPDYVAVSAITALGSVIGRRAGIKPKERADWTEHANLWGCFVGSPGMLQSSAMMAALAPLYHLEAEAA